MLSMPCSKQGIPKKRAGRPALSLRHPRHRLSFNSINLPSSDFYYHQSVCLFLLSLSVSPLFSYRLLFSSLSRDWNLSEPTPPSRANINKDPPSSANCHKLLVFPAFPSPLRFCVSSKKTPPFWSCSALPLIKHCNVPAAIRSYPLQTGPLLLTSDFSSFSLAPVADLDSPTPATTHAGACYRSTLVPFFLWVASYLGSWATSVV